MVNKAARQKDILSIISSIDISPSMFKNAQDKYTAIASFLSSSGIEADMYPQGSFALGTVVRPVKNGEDTNYDLDFICKVNGCKEDYSPIELRRKVEETLSSNKMYKDRLEEYKECYTIVYADLNNIGFSIDIVPATNESDEVKSSLSEKSLFPSLIDTCIAIPKHNKNHNYSWITNNPKGFQEWFNKINQPFLDVSKTSYRENLYRNHTDIYSSIEDIPNEMNRSSLQRVIQILKYHRNVFYDKLPKGNDIKPNSAIITTLSAQIAQHCSPELSIFELLKHILDELNVYSKHLHITNKDFNMSYTKYSLIMHENSEWAILNPTNPEDNLADKWNENKNIPETFFKWLNSAYEDLIKSLDYTEDMKFRIALENGLGRKIVNSVIKDKYCSSITPSHINPTTAAKPYKKI